MDKINEISAYPNAGELTQIRSIQNAVGGCVPNVALDLKKIAPELTISAIGTIGDDMEGAFVTNTLPAAGLDISGLVVKEGKKTSFTDVMSIPGGQRTFFTYPGEMFDSIGARIEENSPYRTTLMVGYSQDRKGYLPSSAAYKYTSYETDTTRFAPGTGEQVADAYVAMLNKLKAEKE